MSATRRVGVRFDALAPVAFFDVGDLSPAPGDRVRVRLASGDERVGRVVIGTEQLFADEAGSVAGVLVDLVPAPTSSLSNRPTALPPRLPLLGQRVETPAGQGEVVGLNTRRWSVQIRLDGSSDSVELTAPSDGDSTAIAGRRESGRAGRGDWATGTGGDGDAARETGNVRSGEADGPARRGG